MSEITEIQRIFFFFFFLDLGPDKALTFFKKCWLERMFQKTPLGTRQGVTGQLHETVGLRGSLGFSPCCRSNSSVRPGAETEIDRQLRLPIG